MRKIIQILAPLLFVLFALTSCKDPVETARYELSADELALIPYTLGEEVNFIHSNGFSFNLKVIENKTEWKQDYGFVEWVPAKEYISYQVKTTILESVYPKFYIKFLLGSSIYDDYEAQVLNILVNTNYTSFPYDSFANFVCDSLTGVTHYDSIYLNDKMYYDVVKGDFRHSHSQDIDSSAVVPMSIYYNNLGLIQIEISNHETYTINN